MRGRKNQAHPDALPVFSVDTEDEARELFVASCTLAYDGERYGLPAVLREELENMPAVTAHLERAYAWLLSKREGGDR